MNCMKKKLSLLADLSYDELFILEQNRAVVKYKRGETIFKSGTKTMGLLCLSEGKVKIVRASTGGPEQIIGLKKPIDFLDIRALVTDSLYSYSAVALEDSSVCIIEKENFMKVVDGSPAFSLKLIRHFANELEEVESRFINQGQKHSRARLADAIIQVQQMFGYLPDGQTINCILKRADLAGLSNMTTANAIRFISSFTTEGVLETEGKRIKILRPDRLTEISELSGKSGRIDELAG